MMPSNGGDNEQKLRAADIIFEDELPEPYRFAVEGLTKHEVNMLIAIKKRLDGAAAWHETPPVAQEGLPPWTTFMIF